MQETDVKDISMEDEITPEEGDFEATGTDPVVYEIGYHLLPTLEEDEASKALSLLYTLIEKKDGTVLNEEAPKKTLLAYEMSKAIGGKNEHFSQGLFGWLKCELPATSALLVRDALTADENVLRFFMARTVKEDTLLAGRQFLRSEMKDKEKRAAGATSEAEKAPLSEEELSRSLEKLIAE